MTRAAPLLLAFGLCCLAPDPVALAKPAPGKRAAPTPRPRRPGRPVAVCRDIFCTAEVVRLDGKEGDSTRLTQQQVEKVMQSNGRTLEACLVEARRRDPHLAQVRIEFVVDQRGRVIASRVNGRMVTPLARCLARKLRVVRFPPSSARRTVAAYVMAAPQ